MNAQLTRDIPDRKVCIECQLSLPEGAFGRRRVGWSIRLKSHCMRCEVERQKRYRYQRLGREYTPPADRAVALAHWMHGPEAHALRRDLSPRI